MEDFYSNSAGGNSKSPDLEAFYLGQAGSGVGDVYTSYRYLPQRGNGFFGRFLKGSVIPLIKRFMPYLANKAVDGVGGLVQEIGSGKTIKQAAKAQLKKTASTVLDDMASRLRSQEGSGGRRRKRKTNSNKSHRKKASHKKPVKRATRRRRQKCVLFA